MERKSTEYKDETFEKKTDPDIECESGKTSPIVSPIKMKARLEHGKPGLQIKKLPTHQQQEQHI